MCAEPVLPERCSTGEDMKRLIAFAGTILLMALLAGPALAKEGVERITIAGPQLERSIEISDAEVLTQFNPWGGLNRFLALRLDARPIDWEAFDGPYRVRFFEGSMGWVYEFSYYLSAEEDLGYIVLPEPLSGQGFVHLAGWYSSSASWADFMESRLIGVEVDPVGSGRVVTRWLPVVLLAAAIAAALAPMSFGTQARDN